MIWKYWILLKKWRLIWLLFWIINRNFLKILIKFDRIIIFQGFERILEGYFDDFSVMRMGKNGVKWAFCRTHYRTRKWGFRRENIRYAVLGNRLLALKCKLRPLMVWKDTIIVQYYNMFWLIRCLICYSWTVAIYPVGYSIVIIWHGKKFDFLHFESCQFEKQ